MDAQLQSLFDRQHQRMRELRDDARDFANTVADEVWDKFEVEIEEATADGYSEPYAACRQPVQTPLVRVICFADCCRFVYDESNAIP